jgi:lipoprotein NlpI
MRIIAATMLFALTSFAMADDASDLLRKAKAALAKKDFAEAVKLATQAIEADPKNPEGYDHRGTAQFKLGNIKESLADFDKQIQLAPALGPAHWRRGLTLYYAEKFADGVKQFTSSDKAEPEDVENAVWHFLCNARVQGLKKAQGEMLKVAKDPRGDYMMKIYQMFKGDAKPEDVFKSAEAGKVADDLRKEQRFYANYYVSMYYEAAGEPKKSLEHMKVAVEKYPIGHYMMDVANVHLKLRTTLLSHQ